MSRAYSDAGLGNFDFEGFWDRSEYARAEYQDELLTVAITNIKAIGFKNLWSICGELGQRNALKEWGYPPIGVYFGDCRSAGHDRFCLDYRVLNADGEPAVVHADQEYDYKITPIAASFEAFLRGLKLEENFDTA